MTEEVSQWQELQNHTDYEICVEYPHQIRRKQDKYMLKEIVKNGYLAVYLHQKPFYKHRLIALQFIANPDNLSCIDHINHNRKDNRISNLRWCSHYQNCNNFGKYKEQKIKYVDELPDDAFVVEAYKQWRFENLHFAISTNKFYFFNGINYKVIRERLASKWNTYRVSVRGTDGKVHDIAYSTFKNEYNID